LISVRSVDGELLRTEQWGGVNNPRNGVSTFEVDALSATTMHIHVELPNPAASMAYAEVMMAKSHRGEYPPYDLDTQSCVTYCAQVLRAGGVHDIPLNHFLDATKWLIRYFNEHI
ncbi:hypothetical protein, partial [Nocardia seriolae]